MDSALSCRAAATAVFHFLFVWFCCFRWFTGSSPTRGTKTANLVSQIIWKGREKKKSTANPHISSLLRLLMDFQWFWVSYSLCEWKFFLILCLYHSAYILRFSNTPRKVIFYTVKAIIIGISRVYLRMSSTLKKCGMKLQFNGWICGPTCYKRHTENSIWGFILGVVQKKKSHLTSGSGVEVPWNRNTQIQHKCLRIVLGCGTWVNILINSASTASFFREQGRFCCWLTLERF